MEESVLKCRKKAMDLLNYNDRTEWELRDRLQKAGFGEMEVEDAIAYVCSFHYLDDLRYAIRFAEIYCESRSVRRMKQDLQKKHISDEFIEIALEKIGFDDSAALKKEIRKRLRGRQEISFEERQKIASALYRKGFQTEDIFKELEKLQLTHTFEV